MYTAFYLYQRRTRHRFLKIYLALLWTSGLIFGTSAASLLDYYLFSLMCSLIGQSVSIIGLVLRISFSFLLTVIAVFLRKPSLFLPTAFFHAFLLSFFIAGLICTFSSVNRLNSLLLLCLFIGSSCGLLRFWFRHITEFRSTVKVDLCCCITLHIALGMIERWCYFSI